MFHQDWCNLYSQARYKLFLLIHGKSILCFQHHTTKLHLLHLLLKAICKGLGFLSYFIFISPNGTTLHSVLYYALTEMILLFHSIICLNLIKYNIAFWKCTVASCPWGAFFMVATLEEKYQLRTVKLSKFTKTHARARSKTVSNHTVAKKSLTFAHFNTTAFGCYFINKCSETRSATEVPGLNLSHWVLS